MGDMQCSARLRNVVHRFRYTGRLRTSHCNMRSTFDTDRASSWRNSFRISTLEEAKDGSSEQKLGAACSLSIINLANMQYHNQMLLKCMW